MYTSPFILVVNIIENDNLFIVNLGIRPFINLFTNTRSFCSRFRIYAYLSFDYICVTDDVRLHYY